MPMTGLDLTIKKHWTVYIIPGIIILVALFFVYLSFGVTTKWISISLLVFASIVALSKILTVLNLASVRWSFNGGELRVTKGFLPWNKTHIQIPIFDIYDSSVSSGFMGHYLNFAHISIRRTEGMTSQLSESYLAKAAGFSSVLNKFVQDYKKDQSFVNKNPAQTSDVGLELQRLVDLKNTGVLNEEEFERLKRKLIDS